MSVFEITITSNPESKQSPWKGLTLSQLLNAALKNRVAIILGVTSVNF